MDEQQRRLPQAVVDHTRPVREPNLALTQLMMPKQPAIRLGQMSPRTVHELPGPRSVSYVLAEGYGRVPVSGTGAIEGRAAVPAVVFADPFVKLTWPPPTFYQDQHGLGRTDLARAFGPGWLLLAGLSLTAHGSLPPYVVVKAKLPGASVARQGKGKTR